MNVRVFVAGVLFGAVAGATAPLLAQAGWPYFLGTTSSPTTYAIPSGVRVIFGCSDATGYLKQNSVAQTESIPSQIGGVSFTLAAVTCP